MLKEIFKNKRGGFYNIKLTNKTLLNAFVLDLITIDISNYLNRLNKFKITQTYYPEEYYGDCVFLLNELESLFIVVEDKFFYGYPQYYILPEEVVLFNKKNVIQFSSIESLQFIETKTILLDFIN